MGAPLASWRTISSHFRLGFPPLRSCSRTRFTGESARWRTRHSRLASRLTSEPRMISSLGQPFRTVDEKKVAAVFQRPGGRPEQVGRGTGVLPAGEGGGAAGGAAGKIGGIGDADIKAPRGKAAGNLPHIGAYTFHAGCQTVAADVVQGGKVGVPGQLHAGDAAAFVHGAQQQSQRAAAGAEIQHPGILREPDKMGQHHGIGA